MSLNVQIMSAEELVRWYTPKTENEQALHGKLKETLAELSSFEEDHAEEQDGLRIEIADLVIERNDLEATLTLV